LSFSGAEPYLLKFITCHQGNGGVHGKENDDAHYYSYVRSLSTGQWIKLDDSIVSIVSESDVLEDCSDKVTDVVYVLKESDSYREYIIHEYATGKKNMIDSKGSKDTTQMSSSSEELCGLSGNNEVSFQ
jgi:hypothetical protein